jgi:hypothetical protein
MFGCYSPTRGQTWGLLENLKSRFVPDQVAVIPGLVPRGWRMLTKLLPPRDRCLTFRTAYLRTLLAWCQIVLWEEK